MKFKGDDADGYGYSYANWNMFDLKDLADGIYEFLKLHDEGKKLFSDIDDKVNP
jgi:hypothetical protein